MEIPFDLLKIVASFHIIPKMKLLDWINEDTLDVDGLSSNPNAITLLETFLQKSEKRNYIWYNLSSNPQTIRILEIVLQHDFDKINWMNLSRNSNSLQAIHILEANQDKIGFFLSSNPNIFEIDKKQYNIDINKKANNIDF